MRDLEAELGCSRMTRSARGIELAVVGRRFLDHARVTSCFRSMPPPRPLAAPPRTAFALGS
ncbi:hypothetical protein [Lichenicola sp.]|uniref:hypothetical protein n=1 Tax=Lichenicola sp. TaxID=2804529 RepID=UPI003B005AB7